MLNRNNKNYTKRILNYGIRKFGKATASCLIASSLLFLGSAYTDSLGITNFVKEAKASQGVRSSNETGRLHYIYDKSRGYVAYNVTYEYDQYGKKSAVNVQIFYNGSQENWARPFIWFAIPDGLNVPERITRIKFKTTGGNNTNFETARTEEINNINVNEWRTGSRFHHIYSNKNFDDNVASSAKDLARQVLNSTKHEFVSWENAGKNPYMLEFRATIKPEALQNPSIMQGFMAGLTNNSKTSQTMVGETDILKNSWQDAIDPVLQDDYIYNRTSGIQIYKVNSGMITTPIAYLQNSFQGRKIDFTDIQRNNMTVTWENGEPNTNQIGVHTKNIIVRYADGGREIVPFTYEVTENGLAPTITVTPNEETFTVYRGDAINDIHLSADAPTGVRSLDVSNLPNGLSFRKPSVDAVTGDITGSIDLTANLGETNVNIVSFAKTSDNKTTQKVIKFIVKPQTDKYSPTANAISKGVGSSLTDDDARNSINTSGLPNGTCYSWKTKPTTDSTGNKTGTIEVTYPDDSKDEVNVQVNVTDTIAPKILLNNTELTTDMTTITMYRGESDNIPTLKAFDDSSRVSNFKVNGLPSGVWFNKVGNSDVALESNSASQSSPISKKLEGKPANNAQIKIYDVSVTATDGTNPVTKKFRIDLKEQKEKYNPSANTNTLTKDLNSNLTNEDAKNSINTSGLPNGTSYSWKTKPTTDSTGNKTGTIEVTYPDGSKDTVSVNVTVRDSQAPTITTQPKDLYLFRSNLPTPITVFDASDNIAVTEKGFVNEDGSNNTAISGLTMQNNQISGTIGNDTRSVETRKGYAKDANNNRTLTNPFKIYTFGLRGNTLTKAKGETPTAEEIINNLEIIANNALGNSTTIKANRNIIKSIKIVGNDNVTERTNMPTTNERVKIRVETVSGSVEVAELQVNFVDRVAPVISLTSSGLNNNGADKTLTENPSDTIIVMYRGESDNIPTLKTYDDQGRINSFSVTGLPNGLTFTQTQGEARQNNPLSQSLQGNPSLTANVGNYDVTVTSNDGTNTTTKKFRIELKAQNEKYNPQSNQIDKNQGSEVTDSDITNIINTNNLPANTTYTWKTKPLTNTTGIQTGVIEVTYPDGSKEDVNVSVNVVDNVAPLIFINDSDTAMTNNAEDTPIKMYRGLTDNIPTLKTYDNNSTITSFNVVSGLPAGLSFNLTNGTSSQENKLSQTISGTPSKVNDGEDANRTENYDVTVTSSDGRNTTESKFRIVLHPQKDKYTYSSSQVDGRDDAKISVDAIYNAITTTAPSGTTKRIKDNADIPTSAGNHTVTVEMVFDDGSVEELDVPVKITESEATRTTPTVTTVTRNDQDVITSGDIIGAVTDKGTGEVTLKDPNAPLPTGVGDHKVKVVVTYSDGSVEELDVPVKITESEAVSKEPPIVEPEYYDLNGDNDNDGYTNEEELKAGTNPNDTNSKPKQKTKLEKKLTLTGEASKSGMNIAGLGMLLSVLILASRKRKKD